MSVDASFRNAARRFAASPALIEGERQWSFAELERLVASSAAGLASLLPRGARVGLYMQNRAEYLILQLALERAGLVRVPLNMRYTAFELERCLEDCAAAALFLDAATAERVAGIGAPGLWLCQVDGGATGGLEWKELIACAGAERAPLDDFDALCSINYTSGSSGVPKGTMLSFRNWHSVYKNMLVDRQIASGGSLAHIGPLTHASGNYFTPFLLRGAANVIVEGGALDKLLPTIEHRRVTAFSCVPTVLTRLLGSPTIDRYDLSSLRWIGYGAEAIQVGTLDKAVARWGEILTHNYGLTEAMMTCACLMPQEHFKLSAKGERELRYGCIGRPYTFVDIILRDAQGREVPPGEIGEITIRAEHMTTGYWRRPEETAKAIRDGWLWSGDLARRDEEGFIYLVGRSKEMLISGGFNIYLAELEACLSACPGVRETAVVGVPDEAFGEIAVAFVVADDGVPLTKEICEAHCKPRLGIRTPKRWHFIDALPRTGNGKVDKASLTRTA